MHILSGYTLSTQVHQSEYSVVYRGQHSNGQPVVIKFLTRAYPVLFGNTKLRQEYDIAQRFQSDLIIRPYALEPYNDSYALVLEDFGGVALRELLNGAPLAISTFLQIVLQIVDALGVIHSKGVIHKDINPRNIIVHPETYQTKIADFGIASVLSQENQLVSNPDLLEGTLSYMSPEQTGRMNRPIDYRTDFYSLGVVCYEMLTGHLPFTGNDPLELVHQHMAKVATPPHGVRPTMPLVLSQIVMKLLAKSADERYQSAFGLRADLAACLQQYEAHGQIESFALGRFDLSDRFQLPQKLYGRDAAVEKMVAVLDDSAQGTTACLLITGLAGVGKSALVQEIHKPLIAHKGYLMSGKFDQYKKGLPYSALIQAFEDFVRQILTESAERIAMWRNALLQAFGSSGQVLIELVPDLELIIGKQPPVVELEPLEAQHRFTALFKECITVMAQPDHPLVLFIDDLQWADIATLKLLEFLLSAPDLTHLLLIGAYRDNEVDQVHPLARLLEQLRENGTRIEQITVHALSEAEQRELIADTLHTTPEAVAQLAHLIASRTDGNPFFVSELLKTLHQKELLVFDQQHGRWSWDWEHIQQLGLTQNVVDLMRDKIQDLEAETQAVLQLAACIGNTFNLHTLALVHEASPRKTAAALYAAVELGLIVPVGDTYRLLKFLYTDTDDTIFSVLTFNFRFLHDRIQQAAYQLMPDHVKEHVHLRIGRYLKARSSEREFDEQLFDIVNHLNRGRELITDSEERYALGELNQQAGLKAKSSTAYAAAAQYFINAIELSPAFGWQTEYERTYQLHVEVAEVEYLQGNAEVARMRCEELLQHVRTPLEKAEVYEIILLSYTAQRRFKQGIDTALKALNLLGVELPRHPGQLHVVQHLVRTRFKIGLHSPKRLAQQAAMDDPVKRTAMRLMVLTAPLAYQSEPDLLPILIFVMVRLSVEHGNTALSSYAYMLYGMAMNGVLGNLKAGLAYTQTGLDIMQRFDAKELRAKNEGMYNFFLRHWKEPLRNTLAPMVELAQIAQEVGDVEYEAYNYFFYCQARFVLGDNLEILEQEFLLYHDLIKRLKQDVQEHVLSILLQMVQQLRGTAGATTLISTANLKVDFESAAFYARLYQAMLLFLLGQPKQALKQIRRAGKQIASVMSMNVVPLFYFYEALILMAVYAEAIPPRQAWYRYRIHVCRRKLQIWARYAPANQQHRVDLLAAEYARITGDSASAMHGYAKAIVSSREAGYIHEQALTNELAAQFYLSLDNPEMARILLIEAYRGYKRWGATAKLQQLEAAYVFLRRKTAHAVDEYDTLRLTNNDISTSTSLDIGTVIKASQTISSEIQLPKLLDKLMRSVIENAGAEKGFLLLKDGARWMIEAAGALDDQLVFAQALPIDVTQTQLVPQAVIDFVARTRTHVLLNDATLTDDFLHDPYIQARQPKSILCTPLLKQGELIGVLYLENNLAAGVFTAESLEVLNLLASQAAISIDNARLYANLEYLVAQRTLELSTVNKHLQYLNDQLTGEVRMARTIQQNLLPLSRPPWTDLTVFCNTTPARAVGGDLYTYYAWEPTEESRRYAVVVGDVSGKGMPAALLMGVSLASFRGVVDRGLPPSELLTHLDREMVPYTSTTRQNCAMVYVDLCIDADAASFRVANAGCVTPLLRYADGTVEWLEVGGFPLGTGLGKAGYAEHHGVLEPGATLILSSDGVVEAMNTEGEMFGFERFEKSVAAGPADAIALLDHIKETVSEFIGPIEAHDDITLVIIQPNKKAAG